MCDGCLPGRLGNCHNSTRAAPAPAPARANMSAAPANMSAAPAMGTNSLGNVPSVSTACLLSVSQQPCAGAFTVGQTASASSRSVNVCPPSVPGACQSSPLPLDAIALPSLDSILRMRVSTLHHVPKGARDAWAGIVGDVLWSICSDPTDVVSWVKFFMLARCILTTPARGGRSHWHETLKVVRSRIAKWRRGEVAELWEGVVAENERLKRRHRRNLSSSGSSQLANASRARRAVEDGQYRKAIQSLSSDGLADATEDVFDEMLTKHPQAGPPCIPSDPVPPPLQVREVDVVRALQSFPNGTAPGPSSFRANHFKEAVFCPSPDRANYALRGLVGVVNHLCAGRVPHVVLPHLCGASLFACKKKGGGHHPIAVGEVLRRLTSKCVCWAVLADAIRILSPLQVGVGLPVGCEAIVHSVTSVQEDVSVPPDDRCTLLVDFSNAFNSVDREGMFRVVRARIPSMAAWLECCYGSQPLLHLGERTILSCCGVQQGDPLGPLGFALALHPIIEKIKEEVPSLLINAWYLDDGTLCGSVGDLCSALAIIESEGPSRGLLLNRSKSHLCVPMDASFSNNPLPPSIPVSRRGFDLLGSPIGPSSHCESSVY